MNNRKCPERTAAFKKELRALLLKYKADLCFMGDGDLHGVHGEGIGVEFGLCGEERLSLTISLTQTI